jgi:Transposase DNA-binding/Transposase Tn5 dimerisation domain
MDGSADARIWAEQQFGTAELGDQRRTRRLVHSAMKIALHPEKSFNQVFDWNELRGFYNLCDRDEVSYQAVLQPHWDNTRQAMAQHPVVLILHDTTELDYSNHKKLVGTGQIGNENGKGFLQHNSLALVPQSRQVLGLAYQQLKVRQAAPEGESTYQRKRRARESDLWVEGIKAPGRPPENSCWVDVCDRGSDDYQAMRAAHDLGHHFLFRAAQNRSVFVSADQDQQAYVLDYARSLPSVGRDQVDIPGRGGRPARTATVALAAAPVWIPAPAGTPQRQAQPLMAAWIVRIWEPEPPADVTEPLDWILWCSLPTQTLAELKERRDWYCLRWLAEVYHHVEKNGCSEEDRRFETAERMARCLAILAVVAVRVFQLRNALDHQPDAPAEQVGTTLEIKVVQRVVRHKGERFTVRDFVRGVAKLGGFLGRKSDGNPGVLTLWRGYQRLQDMLEGFQLSLPDRRQPRKDLGNR